ncbi:MAG: ATP-binding protein, partial [Clostridiales bacterium]
FIHFIKNNELNKKNDTEFLIIDKIIKNIKTAHTNNRFMKFEFHYEINDEYYLIEIIPFNNKKFRIIDQNGTVIIFKDITEVKKLNIKLVEQDRLVNLGILSGGIAHDISNPASVIESGLYYLKYNFKKLENENNPQKKNILQSKISKSLDTTYSACNKILFMVKSIKNQTRNLSSGDIREFSINSLLKDVLLILDHQFKKTYCTYELIESDPKIKITGDYTKLSQVITNLIINSVEAYENKPGLVKIILKKSSDNAIIIVEDKAGGIKNKKHETIFKDIISTKKNGTGLGLYISHRLITSDFDGKMSFETQLDIGTTFTISIPMFKR